MTILIAAEIIKNYKLKKFSNVTNLWESEHVVNSYNYAIKQLITFYVINILIDMI
jgi:hypothetical protein